MHAKAIRFSAYWSEIGKPPGCPVCETPGPDKSHTRECKAFQDVLGRESTHGESGGGTVADSDTRAMDPSSSSTDVKCGIATDFENSILVMRTLPSDHLRFLIRWNPMPIKSCIWQHITKLVVIKRGEALIPRLSVVYLGFECRRVQKPERRLLAVCCHVRGRMLGTCSLADRETCRNAVHATDECEFTR